MTSETAQAVLLDPGLMDEFVHGSIRAYEECTPELPPRNWAILLGQFLDDVERRNGTIYHSLGAWSAQMTAPDLAEIPCRPVSIRYRSLHVH